MSDAEETTEGRTDPGKAVDSGTHTTSLAKVVPHFARGERVARGKAARTEVPRSAQAQIEFPPGRDPIALLQEQAASRVPELVPIRYGRMRRPRRPAARLLRPPTQGLERVVRIRSGRSNRSNRLRKMCGWTLARAHARSGDRVAIASYLGNSGAFDQAIADFSETYADQNERDYKALQEAVATGRVEAQTGL